ncbi:MAG: lysophospholipid acyltransferase family protein [Paludibacteraceae bacterium]|nr:lysophospholipid acyltransferase family protein [Paludibacteraceae bacterium]MBR4839317.1 lysophospholipid acyltransferase family protein [Paludibacteraceae bacterium]
MAILYYLLYPLLWLISCLPFCVMYAISDMVYFLVYHVVRYRRKVVRTNLTNSFPEKSLEEIRRIEKAYYSHFADLFFETVKLMHISDEEIKKRMHFSNPELMYDICQNNSAVVLLGHYGNWEWIPSIFIDAKGFIAGELYRPLKNKYFDGFFLKLRSRFGTFNIPKNDALKAIFEFKQQKKNFAMGFIADQTPSKSNLHYWANFLNQDTPFLNGPERIAKKNGFAVIYFDVSKVKRGYYTCDLVLLTENARNTKENEITDQYVALFEQTLRRNPAYWLWSHKRWKHKREVVQ